MSVKKYIIGLAATFAVGMGAGVYVGYKHSRDIEYALCKTEKEVIALDQGLKKWTPRIAAEIVDSVDDIKREMILDMREQEAKDKQKKRITHLDKVINDYESGK
jgi:hypothetical protein